MTAKTPVIIQALAYSALLGAKIEAAAIAKESDLLVAQLRAYEQEDGPEPDRLAQAVASVIYKENVGFPTDGEFVINTEDGELTFPLTYQGLLGAAQLAEATRAELQFRAGPDGAYATATREALALGAKLQAEQEILRQSSALGEAISKALN